MSKSQPFMDNYPDLKAWILKIDAICNWQRQIGNMMVESWSCKGTQFIVLIRANGNGWDIFTPCQSNRIDETLRDAEQRLLYE